MNHGKEVRAGGGWFHLSTKWLQIGSTMNHGIVPEHHATHRQSFCKGKKNTTWGGAYYLLGNHSLARP